MTKSEYEKIRVKLCNRRNWTPELLYVHKTRLLIGFVAGLVLGFIIGLFF